jgi:hypothetical protein
VSLHANTSITQFATACATLWNNWAAPPGGAVPKVWRRTQITNMINAATNGFMTPPNVAFEDTGSSNGSFGWGGWRLRLRKDRTKDDALAYADFVRYCRTMYHETRHAEQFYRIAQGLAAGSLRYPDKTNQEVMQKISTSGGGGTFGAKKALFEGISTGNLNVSDRVIADWLRIPFAVAQSAYNSRAQYAGFVGGAKPAWFRRANIQLEVEEWMRATYKGTLSALNSWTQGDDGPYKMYRDQPEEHDAHGIGNAIVAAIDTQTGTPSGVPDY